MRGCVRLGCLEAAVAGIALDPEHQRVWIVDIPADDPRYIGMCHAHTDNLTVPVGWSTIDERCAQTALFGLASPRAGSERRHHSRLDHRRPAPHPESKDAPRLSTQRLVPQRLVAQRLFDDEFVALSPVPASAASSVRPSSSSADTAAPWIGKPDKRHTPLLETDDESPLLARAFRASRAS